MLFTYDGELNIDLLLGILLCHYWLVIDKAGTENHAAKESRHRRENRCGAAGRGREERVR